MGRAEMRRTMRGKEKTRTVTYNLTESQLQDIVRKRVDAELQEAQQRAVEEAVNTAMTLLLTLPLEVLMDHYWTKSYAKRIPEFT